MSAEHDTEATPRGPRVHDIGPGGAVVIAAEANDVRVRGVDGTEARVVSPADGAGIETVAEPGRFTVRAGRFVGIERTGFLGLKVGDRGFGVPLRFQVSGTVEVEVPRDARLVVSSSGGDVAVREIRGGISAKTASGDISVKRAAGTVAAEAASGDVHVAAADPIALEVRSVSGDVRGRAPRFDRVAIETVSGDVELAGRFAPGGLHAISTVSGDVELALVGGLTLEARTVSGSVDCQHPERRDGDGRRRPLVVGDGLARLAVRTMSGDVEVRAGKAGPPSGDEAPAGEPGATIDVRLVGVRTPPAQPTRPAPPSPPPSPGSATPSAEPDVAGATLAGPVGGAPAAPSETEAGIPPASGTDPTLGVLEALARGEIDVAEAERRLADAARGGAPAPDRDRGDG